MCDLVYDVNAWPQINYASHTVNDGVIAPICHQLVLMD